ncbi:MAG: DUF4157 domain-containing protein [Anaerolineae bacterium]
MGERTVRPSASARQVSAKPGESNVLPPQPETNVAHLLQLQRTIGNRAVTQLMKGHVPKTLHRRTDSDTASLPEDLRTGIESLSGVAMDDVNVHYDSVEPKAINALAYAQGSDIYLGSEQEAHLPHEAWHVVQQKQGRASATTQHMGQALNDESTLEAEADSMGDRASGYTGDSGSLQVRTAPSSAVIQARFPNMSDEFITQNPEMAQDILLNTIDNLTKEELSGINEYLKGYGIVYTNELLRKAVKQGVEHVKYWRTIFQSKLGAGKKLTQEEAATPSNIEVKKESLPKVVEATTALLGILKKVGSQKETVKKVFGPDVAEAATDILKKIFTLLKQHKDEGSSPVSIIGDIAHSKWVGAEAATQTGAEVVQLQASVYEGFLKNDPEAQAAIVHEFSHAVGGTDDIAYSLAEIAKLTPMERLKNAECYAQLYLDLITPNEARYYNPEKVVDTTTASPEKGASNVPKRLAAVKKNVTDIWNRVDNVYGMIKVLLKYQGQITEEQGSGFSRLAHLAVAPYKPNVVKFPVETMAMIEDRARALSQMMEANAIQKALTTAGVTKEMMEGPITNEEIKSGYHLQTTLAIASVLNLAGTEAGIFLEAAKKIPNDKSSLEKIFLGK